jgi:16S rRNA processing protein RimM
METIEFGKIVNTHGLKGEVKVYSYTDNEKKILKLKKVYIRGKEYKVESMRLQKQMFLMKLQGIDDIDQTKFLMNEMCFREVEKNESNDDEGYFIKDLVGMEVIDESGNTIGTLKEVFRTGANDVYEVVDKNNKSIYLPAIKKVIKSIDISSRKMTVELMEGL